MKRVFEEDVFFWLEHLTEFKPISVPIEALDTTLMVSKDSLVRVLRLWLLDRTTDFAISTIFGSIVLEEENSEVLNIIHNFLEEIERRCVDYVLNTPSSETLNTLKYDPFDLFDWMLSLNYNFAPQFCGSDPIWLIDEPVISNILNIWLSGKSVDDAILSYYQTTYPDYYEEVFKTDGEVECLSDTIEEVKKWCVEAVIGLEG